MIDRFVRLVLCVSTFTLSITIPAVAGKIIRVPANQPTIQAAINAANNGDTVVVSPGTYFENINFFGKAITVKSSNGSSVTIIDGQRLGSVITFDSNETSTSVLTGFTIQNGDANNSPAREGGGIAVEAASPTIKSNVIQNNWGSNGGGGIGLGFASPLIQGNIIRNNTQSPAVSGGIAGGGISVRGSSTAQIIGNLIQNNTWPTGFGGGISLFGAWSVLIKNNSFTGNTCPNAGTAISMENDVSGTVIVQNVFTGNNSTYGSPVYWSNPPAALVNNTITDGPTATPGVSLVIASGFNPSTVVANNIFVATNVGTSGLHCVWGDIVNPLKFYNNNVFSKLGPAYGGVCTSQTGSNGNISASPQFISTSNLRLKGGSPGIDVGNNSAPSLPSTDYAGNARIINGNGGSTPVVDMGAYEFVPVVLAPKSLSFGLRPVGSTTSKTVKLTNAQNKVLNISSLSVPAGFSVSGCGSSIAAFKGCTLTVSFHPLTTGSFKGSLMVNDNAGNSPQTVSLSGTGQ